MTTRLFAGVADSAPDPILSLMDSHHRDPRDHKIDLGVGVYRDAEGKTPIMAAVKKAERRLLESQTSKSYTGLAGDRAFLSAFSDLALGGTVGTERLARIATPGGTGAVRHGLELMRQIRPKSRVWLPDPTWPNHTAIAKTLGCNARLYAHAAPGAKALDADRLLSELELMQPADILILHGCCHNPTGLDPDLALWRDIAALCLRTGAVPFVDLAYLGLGDGLQEDAAGLRHLAASLPEMMLAVSGSKNFGLYRERVGALLVITENRRTSAKVQSVLNTLNRLSYTFPPDHGARVAQTILDDADLRSTWENELEDMRCRLRVLRSDLANALEAEGVPEHGLREGRGLFSRLPLQRDQIAALRESHGLYIVDDGRINLAGLRRPDIRRAAAILSPILRG